MSAAGDVHKRIQADAEAVRANPLAFVKKPGDFPALQALLIEATRIIEEATPASFAYEGRRYWLSTCTMMATIAIYATPVSTEPMICVLSDGLNMGHKPGH